MYGSLQTALQALYGTERPPDATDKLLTEHGILLVVSAADRRESAQQFGAIEGMKQDFLEVCRILEAGGVPYVAIKGLPLAQLVYEDYAVRGISDIDVAVPLERYDDAMRVLRTAGLVHQPWDYLHKTVEIFLCPGHGTYLEVHFTLSTAEGFRGFTAEFWHDQDTITVYGRSIPIPTLEVNLVYLLLHLARHLQEPRAVWIEDIRRFLLKFGDTLDWNRVVMLAGRHRLANALLLSITFCDGVFTDYRQAAHFPPEVVAAIRARQGLSSRLLLRFLRPRLSNRTMTPWSQRLYSFSLVEDWRERFGLLLGFVRRRLPGRS
jgi:hypothetical protein